MKKEEFERIIDETKAVVLSAVRKYLFKEYFEYIDDVVQETYYKAYRCIARDRFDGKSKISTWLFIIAKNESIRMNKKLSKQKSFQEKLEDNIEIIQEDSTDNKYDMKNIIKQLPLKYKRVFVLFLQHYTIKDIAEKLALNENTVKTHIFRSKKIISKLMKKGRTNV